DSMSELIENSHFVKIGQRFQSFEDLKRFASDLKPPMTEKNCSSKPTLAESPYHQSLFHFFLYYMPAPNYSFILCTKDLMMYGAFTGNHFNNLMISFPITSSPGSQINFLDSLVINPHFSSLIKEIPVKRIILRDIDNAVVNLLRKKRKQSMFQLQNLKQIRYSTYDLEKTLALSGVKYANLRWHLNKFNNQKHKIKVVSLEDVKKPIIHLIGQWRRDAMKNRGFSYVDIRSDKQGVKLCKEQKKKSPPEQSSQDILRQETVLTRILQVDGMIASFNLGYPLGIFQHKQVFAHAIGIADTSIPHLAEYAQFDFWQQVEKRGYCTINDGPSWRYSLETYKDKFRPIKKKDYFWATLINNS
ncbi:MAG: hypothetical protein KAR20_08210, partial [Candidatus Heimdallarchaeota archaeon]|nr:hypothetical protein [Candidatus Heimdallarchaeota archaeon]